MSTAIQPKVAVLGATAAGLMARAARRELVPGAGPTVSPQPAGALAGLSAARFDELAAQRRATRFFGPRPVAAEALETVCRSAVQAAAALAGDAPPHRWLVFAQRVAGLAPAVHHYTGDGFHRLADLPPEEARYLSLQPQFVNCPALVVPVSDLAGSLGRDGADGYFNLLVGTGYSLHTAWLTAVSAGLSGSLLRGVNPVLLHAAAGLGHLDSRPFLALALGHTD
ncbi:nitroreductase family protein [Kitasatospora cineracea]|uniref:nitroreductase family protein n=1 Tax=Kitasatospora cineracea TaxID=88074 RepID=UPI0036D09D8C